MVCRWPYIARVAALRSSRRPVRPVEKEGATTSSITAKVTPGQSYYLKIDGYAGDICYFTLSASPPGADTAKPISSPGPIQGPASVYLGSVLNYFMPPVANACASRLAWQKLKKPQRSKRRFHAFSAVKEKIPEAAEKASFQAVASAVRNIKAQNVRLPGTSTRREILGAIRSMAISRSRVFLAAPATAKGF